MKSRTAKKLRYMRRKSIWPFIILFCVMIVLGAVVISIMVSAILGGMLNNKMHDTWRDAYTYNEYIQTQLEAGISPDRVIYEVSNMEHAPLAINVFDKNGNLIAYYGASAAEEIGRTDIVVPDIDIVFWGVNFTAQDTDYTIDVDFGELTENMLSNVVEDAKKHELSKIYVQEIYRYDYWINTDFFDDFQIKITSGVGLGDVVIDVSDWSNNAANYKVLMKFDQNLYVSDCYIIIPIAFIAVLIFMVIIVAQLCSTISNISSHRKMLKMLLEDPVTEGHNMLAFEQYARRELNGNKRKGYAVVDMSLARYQNYCTLYGIEEGERLLTEIDRTIRRKLRRGEMVAKSSASDFAILLSSRNADGIEKDLNSRMSEILRTLPEDLKNVRRGVVPFQGISNIVLRAGMYVMNPALTREARIKRRDRSHNIDQLYMKAEIAKQGLGDEAGLMVYNHKMWEDELWAQKVEDMQQAALDDSEFSVYIQPKYHPSTEELMGGEALVRWISPKEGFISPGQFIPIFEKNGFITKLDDYMITHTAELQAKWLAEGKKIVPISVNVSRLHFSQPDLAEHIKELVDQYKLPHKYIEIELTESAFFDDKKILLGTVKKLQEYGFEVSMDDFGAGYSSLNSLKDLPLDVLKLDAEFFRGGDFDSRGEIVVSEAIALAKQLNMKIVAEGIEKKEQVEFLAKQDCDMIQGYYFAKPMPANEYEGRMQNVGEEPRKTAEETVEKTVEETVEKSAEETVEKSAEEPIEKTVGATEGEAD